MRGLAGLIDLAEAPTPDTLVSESLDSMEWWEVLVRLEDDAGHLLAEGALNEIRTWEDLHHAYRHLSAGS